MGIDRWRWMMRIGAAVGMLISLVGGVGAVEVTQGPEVVVAASGTQVTLNWRTDAECGTRVRYGLVPDKLEWKAGDGVAVQHSVTLDSLMPGTTYYYAVGTAKVRLKSGQFTLPQKGETAEGALLKKKPLAESPAAPRAPPARITWGYLPSLRDHFERHGPDFGAKSEEDYARQAWEFLQRAMAEGLPAKADASDGTLRVFDPGSGAFAAYNRDGTTKTFFKPGSPGYWDRQPGRPVRLRKP